MSCFRLVWIAVLLCVLLRGEVRVSGHVTSDTNAPVASASITIRRAGPGTESYHALTDPTGAFSIAVSEQGDYLVKVERTGFFSLNDYTVAIVSPESELKLTLNPVRELAESIDVSSAASSVSLDETTSGKEISGKELLDIPQASTHNLQSAMRVLPGVVQDSRGGVHVNGGAENQVLYLLDGFNIGDPLRGAFDTRLGVESVQSMNVSSGYVSAEYGKGSAGVVSIETKAGDDRIRYSGTNFVPGFGNQKGWRIGSWTPRLNLSGPIRRGRAWFSDTFMGQYSETVIPELPSGEDASRSWRYTNLLRANVNVTPSNILSAGFLSSVWTARRTGLSAIDPPETTSDRRSRQSFFNVKDQIYFGRGALAEFGYGSNRTFQRQIPQGQGPAIITPNGRRGNFYMDGLQRSSRDQVLANVFLPSFALLGGHQVKTGIDLDRVAYDQNNRRNGYEIYSASFTPIRKITYTGSGIVSKSNLQAAAYAQDSWRVRRSVLLELGLRSDWDRILGNWNLSPRVGVAWAPPRLENTKLSGGYAISYDTTGLELFTRPYDQLETTTWFSPYVPANRSSRSLFVIPSHRYASPRFSTWSASIDHRFGSKTFFNVEAQRRRGARGLTYAGASSSPNPADSIFELSNERTDVYDSAAITVRQNFRKDYEWLASYTRSAASSSAVIDISGGTASIVTNNLGPMPWDSPNRFLSWGYLPAPWKEWAVAYLLETRSGFPFSVQNDTGRLVGNPNSWRYPVFFELNLHVEKKFRFHRQLWAGRVGYNNITNHRNPNTVIDNIDSDRFLQFYGGQSRALVFRVRWLGKL